MPIAETPTPTLRAARATVFAALCVLVGAVGHDAFSVGAIPLWALIVGGAGVFLAASPLTRRERGLPTIIGLMAGVQVGLHELFAASQRGGSYRVGPTALARPARDRFWCGHSEPAGLSAELHIVAPPSMSGMSSQHSMTYGMWAAHLAAALVAAWWLRRGEAAVWSLARTLGPALITPLVLLAAALVPWVLRRHAAAPVTAAPARLGPGRLLRFALARRGPPMTAAAFV